MEDHMLDQMQKKLILLRGHFDLDRKITDIAELEKHASQSNIWDNPQHAKEILARLNYLKKTLAHWEALVKEVSDLKELEMLAVQENDDAIIKDIEISTRKISDDIQQLEIATKLSGEHDTSNAIMEIHAGAGGTESCDWAEMLLRMYMRWAEKKGFQTEVVDILVGEEAGIKSITLMIKGEYAYGLLQSEVGVHRLVRISPFDSNKRRHTSFSSVDVLPELEDDAEIKIEDKEIRIDTYRASGHGGQYLNKTDSAVRITHLPTNIVVQSQNERSQLKNRVTAMKLLKSRLYEMQLEKQRQSIEKHYDEKGAIAWGSQIRSYVFMPYQLVKDHRTACEVPQVDLVMDGAIDPFIAAYLEWKLQKKQ
ncbi:MAG: peptide chain release factor 2 [Endomicrobiales bacterium]